MREWVDDAIDMLALFGVDLAVEDFLENGEASEEILDTEQPDSKDVKPEDDVYVVVTQQGSTVGTIDTAGSIDETMDGAPEATDEDQKILRLPPLKKKAL